LDSEQLAEGLGRKDIRQVTFDCAQSWLYPPGAGWYVLPRDVAVQPNRFTAWHLTRARLTFEQKRTGFVPPFAVYEWTPGEAASANRIQTGVAAPSDWPPTRVEMEGKKVSAPLPLADGLVWLGYRISQSQVRAGQAVELETFWQVERPPSQPLSLMAHVVASDGRVVAVGDALGVPVEQWLAGDIIAQRHLIEIPRGAAPASYWVQIGAYTLADLRRLAIMSEGQPTGDRILLTRVEVVE